MATAVRAADAGSGSNAAMRLFLPRPTYLAIPLLFAAALPAQVGPAEPQWIWDAAAADDEELCFRKTFDLAALPKSARLAVTCDNHCRVYVNGVLVVRSDTWEAPMVADVAAHLRTGRNAIAVFGANDNGRAALVAKLLLRDDKGVEKAIVSDTTWKVAADEVDGWQQAAFDDSKWAAATSQGLLGARGLPWRLGPDALDGETEAGGPQPPAAAPELKVPEGFVAERLLQVPRSMGSWVCMCTDPKGRLYASDQMAGLYRITPAAIDGTDATTSIERVPVAIGGCQGLLWAFDSLYAAVNGKKSGLYRLRDTDGDDMLDKVELLRALQGDGEHGPHAVVLAPDGEHLLVMCGNHVLVPELKASRLPRNWAEDSLLPRIDDPNGHAVGIKAPGGYVCLCDKDGKEWELYCAGFRNAYGLAVRPDGEVFTWDSDMEWDMGMPWYMPTRVLHVLSGADYGWRSGSARWPADYPDSPPAVLDIGPGSPTGVTFGGGVGWRDGDGNPMGGYRLLCCDWTFGTVYAVDLGEHGAGFRGSSREVVVGEPLPVSSLVTGKDDAIHLLTGGRGLQSMLYRVRGIRGLRLPGLRGFWFTEPPVAQRRDLEQFHGRVAASAVADAWQHLGSDDAVLRHAARIAVESQPVEQWRERALAEGVERPWSLLTAMVALARQGAPADQAKVIGALTRLDFTKLDELRQVAWLRAHELALLRLGDLPAEPRAELALRLQRLFPTGRQRVDEELCALLCKLGAPGVLDLVVPLLAPLQPAKPPPWMDLLGRNAQYGGVIKAMLEAMPPVHQIAFANALRTVPHGWTLEQRTALFTFLGSARRQKGGASYDGFLKVMVEQAWQSCTDAEKAALATVAGKAMAPLPGFRSTPPQGPGRQWQLDEAAALAKSGMQRRDFEKGRNLFHAVGCASCHRFGGEGGSMGPDLTSLGNKFTARDVLEATLEPGKVVSDQYAATVLRRKDGTSLFGRAVEVRENGALTGYDVWPAVADPKPVRVPLAAFAALEPSPLSPMPKALCDPLAPGELLDLLAFLLSRGDRKGPAFR